MKKNFTLLFVLVITQLHAQLLTWTPAFIQQSSSSVTITVDATMGSKGLQNYTPVDAVYVHIGVITNKNPAASPWKYVPSFCVWGSANPLALCTSTATNKWSFTITGGLRAFFGITDATETIQKIAILFRSADGNSKAANTDGTDMYVPVYDNGTYARVEAPFRQPMYSPQPEPLSLQIGSTLVLTGSAANATTVNLYFNGTKLATSTTANASVSASITVAGNQQVIAEAIKGALTNRDTLNLAVASANTIAALPTGVTDGINYDVSDPTVATLVLYAPNKSNVLVTGDFNNWSISSNQMNVTPDGLRYWIRLTGLTSGAEYAYQYWIDGSLRVADYNTEKILDPDNDSYIPAATYPNLKAYPTGKTTGIVSILQTAKPTYVWQVPTFTRPDKRNLIIYELLVRDFTAAQNFKTLTDTLSYLKRLGVNAIEVMPFNEFEGNSSWGYNPSFYLAPDKAYGTETDVRKFIDACHSQGMAVIMDMVMNHAFGSSPMVKMYWDAANNRPATNSPWFNPIATHPYSVGYDFNHEAQATKDLVDKVVTHWLINYKVDGFRWDLAKGFTQNTHCNASITDETCISTYDSTRVATWKRIYDKMQSVSTGSYCILEDFVANTEETELANYGMMIWGNLNTNYQQATMGYNTNWDLNSGLYTNRGYNQPNLVTYQESHDEERLMFKEEQYGNTSGNYNIKTIATGLNRNAMATAIWAMTPGPKMLWQFGELGYDYSRCYLATNGDGGDCNTKTDPKPVKWNYYLDSNRRALYNVYSKLFQFRNIPKYLSTFTGWQAGSSADLSGSVKQLRVNNLALSVVAFGNFDVVPLSASITFPSTGTWFNYLTPSSTVIQVNSLTYPIILQPGEYYVYTNKDVNSTTTLTTNWLSFSGNQVGNGSVQLNWTVGNDFNSSHYEVERSTDSVNFTVIVNTVAKTSTVQLSYSFVDAQPVSGNDYYRIKEVDSVGKFYYSSIIKVNFTGAGQGQTALWQVYPNPSYNYSGRTALHLLTNVNQLQLTLTDVSGRILYQYSTASVTAGQQIAIPLQNPGRGLYLLNVNTDKGKRTEKIVVF